LGCHAKGSDDARQTLKSLSFPFPRADMDKYEFLRAPRGYEAGPTPCEEEAGARSVVSFRKSSGALTSKAPTRCAEPKAGVCFLAHEDKIEGQMLDWLKKWSDKTLISDSLEGNWSCGGRKATRVKVDPHADHPEVTCRPNRSLAVTQFQSRHALDNAQLQLIYDKLADSTQKTYEQGWRWWELFCRRRGVNPVMYDPANHKIDEQLLLDYVWRLYHNLHRAHGTIKLYLAAVKARHVCLGCPGLEPLMPRVYMTLDGIKRRQGGISRRKAVTVEMLRALHASLDIERDPGHAMIWSAVLLAWFFLLRSSEYAAPDGSASIGAKGVRGADLVPKLKGEPVGSFALADEVVLTIRGSKTDQFNRGEVRNHFRSGDNTLDVVGGLACYEKHAPHRFKGSEATNWLFRWAGGAPLTRAQVQAHLCVAAEQVGLKGEDLGSHSLRFGGASALYNAFRDTGMVQRWGRWASCCFQLYIWEARAAASGVSSEMIKADFNQI